ncbi:MAG: 50S ribosomal protein L11 methyltransferase [Eubacterium sp.]|nr:50S ribosomal protein L11 methyltransferase [Eubacterium sp.]
MKWNRYTIETITAAEDMISALLHDLGVEGVEIENNVPLTDAETGSMFIDFPLELAPDDGTSRVSFYLDAAADDREILEQVRAALKDTGRFMDIGAGTITKSQTEDLDWMNNWKQFFSSFSIGNIFIKPTWEEWKEPDHGKILIEIDPGISFGTGKHETTQLCIRGLQSYMQAGAQVLDIGCGSGILSIAALKLGASHVTGIDIDENCIVSSYENMKINHFDETAGYFYAGNLLTDEAVQQKEGCGTYDLVTANILADVIIPMAPFIVPCLKEGGIFISSGIIDFKEIPVREAVEQAGFEVLEVNRDGEWVNITARKVSYTGRSI